MTHAHRIYEEHCDRMVEQEGLRTSSEAADFDADETNCPACGAQFATQGAERCPDCGLRFG